MTVVSLGNGADMGEIQSLELKSHFVSSAKVSNSAGWHVAYPWSSKQTTGSVGPCDFCIQTLVWLLLGTGKPKWPNTQKSHLFHSGSEQRIAALKNNSCRGQSIVMHACHTGRLCKSSLSFQIKQKKKEPNKQQLWDVLATSCVKVEANVRSTSAWSHDWM